MRKVKYSISDVKKAVTANKSVAGVLRQLGLRPIGGNYKTIKQIILLTTKLTHRTLPVKDGMWVWLSNQITELKTKICMFLTLLIDAPGDSVNTIKNHWKVFL